MAAAKHTPGPVDVEIGEASYQVCFGEDGAPWMVRVRTQCRKSPVPYTTSLRRLPLDSAKARAAIAKATGEAEANARLVVVAAPKLLEALKRWDAFMRANYRREDLPDLWDSTAAAIAQVKGGA